MNHEYYSNDSPVDDDNQRQSFPTDFVEVSHSETSEHDDHDEFGAAVEHDPPVPQHAGLANHVPSETHEEVEEELLHHREPSPPQAFSRHVDDARGDIHRSEQPPRHHFTDEEEDDVKGSDFSVSSVEEEHPASHTSELLKQRMPPKVRDILYWNCPFTSAALLSSLLLIEICLLFFSVISVLAYTGLIIMLASFAFKLYTQFVSSGSSTTLHRYMEADWSISRERTEHISRQILEKINHYALYTRDLFLINNYGESIKFTIFLYILTYIGAWFNFLTLVILATIVSFTIPKVYDIYKREIDHVIYLGRRQFKEKWAVVQEKMVDLPVVGQKLKRN